MNSDKTGLLSRRHILKSAAAFSCMPWLSGCSFAQKFVVAGHIWPGYEFIYMARDLDWLKTDDIELMFTHSASESMQALRDQRAHAAMLTLDEAIRLCSEGLDLKIVLVFDISLGADVVISRPSIQHIEQLRAKRIGVEDSALGALMFHQLLAQAHLQPQEVTKVTLTIDQHLLAWQTHKIDAVITYEPNAGKLIKSGGFRLFDSRQIPDMIFDVLVVNKQAINSHQSALRELIRAHFKGLHHYRVNPMDASYRVAKRLGLPAEEVLQVYRGLLLPDALANYAYLSEQDQRVIEAANYLVALMKQADIMVADCDLRDLLTNQFIPKEYL